MMLIVASLCVLSITPFESIILSVNGYSKPHLCALSITLFESIIQSVNGVAYRI